MRYPFGTITITDKAKELVNKALESKRVSQGKYVKEFEERFADLIGVKEAVAVTSGTDADTLALSVLYDYGAKRGDNVIIPSLTFVATANSVINAGFVPNFVDVERDTLNINPERIKEKINEDTIAIMPVHLMGKPADMNKISQLAKQYDLKVIEDAAEAHGTKYHGRDAGTMGDMGAFSLYLAHIISSVEGGIITTDNKDYAKILRSLRSHGRWCSCSPCRMNITGDYCQRRFQDGKDMRFTFQRIGYSTKMNELEAAVGLGTLDIYHDILEKRIGNLDYLIENLQEFGPILQTFKKEDYEVIGPHAFPIILSEDAPFTREQYAQHLEQNGIETRVLFDSIPTGYDSFKFMGHTRGDFPESEYIGEKGLHIGVHQDLENDHLDYFLEKTRDFVGLHS
ncbi:DegT/DnrJ/EryC1/StrS family aminotransferase [Candidatus Pacearchaeota archaeon]|nr:DegT/DnrJ/EryC1/StrS family aminotransferase [Candidatus Pacearchaeota archaeon]